MLNVLVVVHVVVALLLIILVLLQDSKGGAMGGMLGGGGGGGGASSSLFGPSGATSLAAKATRYMAVVFAATSIGLTTYTSTGQRSVIDDVTTSVPAGATGQGEALLVEDDDLPAMDDYSDEGDMEFDEDPLEE